VDYSKLDPVQLPSHLVAYHGPTTTTTPTTTPLAPTATVTESAATVTPTTQAAPAPVVTPPPTQDASGYVEHGDATWYAAAPAGKCASPTLPFGTVLTVTNMANGLSTTCVVDDREESGYPRVVDLSPSNFSQIADLGQGVVDVTISW
jgi:rare lipoprotein A (peptidoglycan hydrolase)